MRSLSYIVGLCVFAGSASAQILWDEGVSGGLSSDPMAPTPVTLSLGSNLLTGTMGTPDKGDYLALTIPAGWSLNGPLILEYVDIPTGGPGSTGFHAMNADPTSHIPGPAAAGLFMGGDRLITHPAGTDMLPMLAAAPLASTGFSVPLRPGTYTYLVQQTGPDQTAYSLDLVVIPAPTAGLVLIGGVALTRRHR